MNCEHEWKEADCENPKMCQLCGSTEGEKIEHRWEEANCENPKTCQLCGLTDGEKGGHTWKNASCTMSKTCSICGLSEGEPLSSNKTHTWQDATCVNPKMCTVCGESEGQALGHSAGDWQITDEGTCEEQGTKQQMCVVCNIVMKTEQFDSSMKIAADIIKEVVKKHSGSVSALEAVPASENTNLIISCAVLCENSEQTVKNILSDISLELQKQDFKAEVVFAFGDVEEESDGECLAIGEIDVDGEYTVQSMSREFKTERNEWVNNQFSAWDGSHRVLEDLIKDNLNDESSYKHIETTFIDINSEDRKKEVNNLLKESGYSQRVEIDDLFVMTKFSAKNAFNATIKSTAFGIADYSENIVTLIAIE